MYPFVRAIKELVKYRNAPALEMTGTHVSPHRCWPQDLDWFIEMNNGRILTILDLSRNILATRTGLVEALRKGKWGLTMAGVSVRYRRRIRPFNRLKVYSRCVGWDDKFFYLDQSIWIGDTCAAQALYRSAVTGPDGIVPPHKVITSVDRDPQSPPLPDWVDNWISADGTRPWPPEIDLAAG